MKMYLGGEWVDRDEKITVLNPYDGSVLDTVPSASIEDVDSAVASAEPERWPSSPHTSGLKYYTGLLKS